MRLRERTDETMTPYDLAQAARLMTTLRSRRPARALTIAIATTTLGSVTLGGQESATEWSAVQDTARIGNGVVDASFMQPYSAEFRLTRVAPDGTRSSAGRWTDDVTIIDVGGRPHLRRELARYDSTGTRDMWRIHVADRETLAPLRLHMTAGPELRQITHLDYSGSTVTATIVQAPDSPAARAVFELAEEPFDLGAYATLLASFPLEEDYEAVYPILGQTGQLEWERMQVKGRERVETIGGEVDSWIVETASYPWTAWLTKEAPYIARIVQRWPDGSEWVSEQVR